ncbi:MAG TPA: hypothetical protein DEP45_07260 [Armatimonadetes bacterium]|nr:hypothetical protein [Armatimonadota bacterium]
MVLTARRSVITSAVAAVALMVASCGAWAQWDQDPGLGVAASWAYSGGDNGYRLEFAKNSFVVNGGFFNADWGQRGDGDVYGLEVGMGPGAFMKDYEGTAFAVGLAAYRFSPDDPEQDNDNTFTWWLGAGDFEHEKGGLFYQYRYIFGGPIEGSQGIVGWAF